MIQAATVRPRPVAKRFRTRVARAPRTIPPAEAAALTFLTDVLVGDTQWQLGEVQNLLALHTLIAIDRWHAAGLDDHELAAG